jgi:arylsulfatase A-like enzyme
MQCVQLGRWKYIRDALGREQLFDLPSDPDENSNLAPDNSQQELLERMRRALRETNPEGALSPWPAVPKLPESD